MERDAVIEPVGERTPYDEKLLEQPRNPSPDRRGTILRHKNRRDGRHASDAQPGNDTPGIDLADGVRSADLDGGADEEDDGEAHEGELAAEALVEEGGADGAEEAAGGEEGDDVGGDLGVLGAGETGAADWEAEIALEGGEGQDGAHYAGVVAWGSQFEILKRERGCVPKRREPMYATVARR